MSTPESSINLHRSGSLTANLAVFSAMVMWAAGFPAADILLESWGTIALISLLQLIAVGLLLLVWIYLEGWSQLRSVAWSRGLVIGVYLAQMRNSTKAEAI